MKGIPESTGANPSNTGRAVFSLMWDPPSEGIDAFGCSQSSSPLCLSGLTWIWYFVGVCPTSPYQWYIEEWSASNKWVYPFQPEEIWTLWLRLHLLVRFYLIRLVSAAWAPRALPKWNIHVCSSSGLARDTAWCGPSQGVIQASLLLLRNSKGCKMPSPICNTYTPIEIMSCSTDIVLDSKRKLGMHTTLHYTHLMLYLNRPDIPKVF